jgi:hypothetical protein
MRGGVACAEAQVQTVRQVASATVAETKGLI